MNIVNVVKVVTRFKADCQIRSFFNEDKYDVRGLYGIHDIHDIHGIHDQWQTLF